MALLALIPSVEAWYDRFHPVSSILSYRPRGGSDGVLDAFFPILTDDGSATQVHFIELNGWSHLSRVCIDLETT